MTQDEPGGGNACVHTSKGPQIHSEFLSQDSGNAFAIPRGSNWIVLNWESLNYVLHLFVIMLDSCCNSIFIWWLDKGLSRVFKGQTGFETWVLRFRVLGALFSRFRCFIFESWVLLFRDLGASCFGLRFPVLCFLNYQKKLEFQLVLWAGSSHILPARGHFLLALVKDFLKGWSTRLYPCPYGKKAWLKVTRLYSNNIYWSCSTRWLFFEPCFGRNWWPKLYHSNSHSKETLPTQTWILQSSQGGK